MPFTWAPLTEYGPSKHGVNDDHDNSWMQITPNTLDANHLKAQSWIDLPPQISGFEQRQNKWIQLPLNYRVGPNDTKAQQISNGTKPHQIPNGTKPHQIPNGTKLHQVSNGMKLHQISNGMKPYQTPNDMKSYQIPNGMKLHQISNPHRLHEWKLHKAPSQNQNTKIFL
ncbi:hypothetical protein ACFX2B_022149 [Malus domestica]